MYLLNLYFQNQLNNTSGFSLIELLIGLSIGSIVTASLCSLLLFCNNANEFAEEKEDAMLNGIYAIEYMENEIKKSDEIIAIEKIKGCKENYGNNFGFVILQKENKDNDDPYYNYILYYLKGDCIRRDAVTKKTKLLPEAREFSGHNNIVDNVKSIDKSYIDFNGKIISINIVFFSKWNRELKFHTDIQIRCPVKY